MSLQMSQTFSMRLLLIVVGIFLFRLASVQGGKAPAGHMVCYVGVLHMLDLVMISGVSL